MEGCGYGNCKNYSDDLGGGMRVENRRMFRAIIDDRVVPRVEKVIDGYQLFRNYSH